MGSSYPRHSGATSSTFRALKILFAAIMLFVLVYFIVPFAVRVLVLTRGDLFDYVNTTWISEEPSMCFSIPSKEEQIYIPERNVYNTDCQIVWQGETLDLVLENSPDSNEVFLYEKGKIRDGHALFGAFVVYEKDRIEMTVVTDYIFDQTYSKIVFYKG